MRISVGRTGRVEHRLHLAFLDLIDAGPREGVENTGIRIRVHILLHASAEEGGHIVVCKFGTLDFGTGQFADDVVPRCVRGSRLEAGWIHRDFGGGAHNSLGGGLGRIHSRGGDSGRGIVCRHRESGDTLGPRLRAHHLSSCERGILGVQLL